MSNRKKITFAVEVKKSLCVGCDRCLQACNSKNFRKTEDGKVEVIVGYKCIGCFKCCDGCLTKAIKVMVSGGRFFSR